MAITFFKASNIDKNLKCSIHKSGKLGFTDTAIKKLNIEANRFIKIGFDEEAKESGDLYMTVQNTEDEYCFKANKAGEYYYINTKALFDMQNIDYVKNSIIYDIIETELDDSIIYKLKKREKVRK